MSLPIIGPSVNFDLDVWLNLFKSIKSTHMFDKMKVPHDQHRDHVNWLSKIDFFEEQIKIFQKELSIVLEQHSDRFSIIEHVDEYKNILDRKVATLIDMRRKIEFHERSLLDEVIEGDVHTWDHMTIGEGLAEFENKYMSVKDNFRKFVAHNL